MQIITDELARQVIVARPAISHKGDFGRMAGRLL